MLMERKVPIDVVCKSRQMGETGWHWDRGWVGCARRSLGQVCVCVCACARAFGGPAGVSIVGR